MRMTVHSPGFTMAPIDAGAVAHLPELHRETRAVLVADLVESVRLVAEDEDEAVRRWKTFGEHATGI